MLKALKSKLSALHRDEQGADMVEYILIVAAIGLPLLGLLIYYRHKIAEWVEELWDKITGEASEPDY